MSFFDISKGIPTTKNLEKQKSMASTFMLVELLVHFIFLAAAAAGLFVFELALGLALAGVLFVLAIIAQVGLIKVSKRLSLEPKDYLEASAVKLELLLARSDEWTESIKKYISQAKLNDRMLLVGEVDAINELLPKPVPLSGEDLDKERASLMDELAKAAGFVADEEEERRVSTEASEAVAAS